MKKKILIAGNTLAAHVLGKFLSKEHDVFITTTSANINDFATAVDIRENSVKELLEFVLENSIDMTIPIGENALKSDIVSVFSENKQLIFGPTASAAELVYNKAFAKKTLYKLRIPTPKFGIFDKENAAIDYVKNQKVPFVIKTNYSNSATIITSSSSAKQIINSIFAEKDAKVIIEDYVYGTPFAYYAITDGYKALPIGSSIVYKHSLEGNGGQLTSGMGACSPNYKLTLEQEYFLMDNVIYPSLDYLEINKKPYVGIIGINGIITDEGKISILGWQSFMQDSDVTNILNSIEDNLYKLFESCIIGSFSDETDVINTNDYSAVSLVLHCINKNNKENSIKGIENISENTLLSFYPNISQNRYLEYEAKNGAVMVITGIASTPSRASSIVYEDVKEIKFDGIKFRKDICKKN